MNKLRFCTVLVLTLIFGASYAETSKGGVCTYKEVTDITTGASTPVKDGKLTWTITDGVITFTNHGDSFLNEMIAAKSSKGNHNQGFKIPVEEKFIKSGNEDKIYYTTKLNNDGNLDKLVFTLKHEKIDIEYYDRSMDRYTIYIDHDNLQNSYATYESRYSHGSNHGGTENTNFGSDWRINLDCSNY